MVTNRELSVAVIPVWNTGCRGLDPGKRQEMRIANMCA